VVTKDREQRTLIEVKKGTGSDEMGGTFRETKYWEEGYKKPAGGHTTGATEGKMLFEGWLGKPLEL